MWSMKKFGYKGNSAIANAAKKKDVPKAYAVAAASLALAAPHKTIPV